MAFPYYPMYQNPYAPQVYQPQSNSGLVWVQGIEGAKSHPVSAGQSVLLMDSESNCFFIKSADASGMPMPLRIFDYTERAARAADRGHIEPQANSPYITREEFEKRIATVLTQVSGMRGDNDERTVSDTAGKATESA